MPTPTAESGMVELGSREVFSRMDLYNKGRASIVGGVLFLFLLVLRLMGASSIVLYR